jgi:hypothetical protein
MTDSIQPTVTFTQEVLTDLHNGLHRIIYAHLALLLVLFSLVGVGGYIGFRSYENQVARAEALQVQFAQAQAQFVASQKQLTDLLATDAAERIQQSAQQVKLEEQIAKRNAQVPAPAVTRALQPTANAVDAENGLATVMSVVPGFGSPSTTPDGKVALSVPQAQQTIQELIVGQRSTADLKDEISLYTLEQAKNSSLSKDLTQCTASVTAAGTALADAKKTIAAYNKVAHQSRFRKILGSIGRNAERVGILVVGIELGHHI